MSTWLFRLILPSILLLSISGCSTMLPERKAPADSQRILEEDVPDSGTVQPKPDESQPPSNLEHPSARPPEESLPPGSRPPRRLKFRDRGMERGWDFPGTNEPFVA